MKLGNLAVNLCKFEKNYGKILKNLIGKCQPYLHRLLFKNFVELRNFGDFDFQESKKKFL